MRLGVPWSVKGIRPEARETAKEAARRSGMPLGDWLNSVILNTAAQEGIDPRHLVPADDDFGGGDELETVHRRLDDLTRRIESVTRAGPEAYAPRRGRADAGRLNEMISQLDQRFDQFSSANRLPLAPALPGPRARSGIDQAVAEITARQRVLNGQAPAVQPPIPSHPVAAPTPAPMPMPAQDLSGLEVQLRHITDQIETLRRPGVEEAINALRGELAEIGQALADAMPRKEIDAIEKQIQGLSQRVAEGKQAGVDGATLSGIEHGLIEVRDALRQLTPAENLIGFNDAVAGLAQKIDTIVAQKDPATLQQLESAITTLRGISTHIASNETVGRLASDVETLAQQVERIASSGIAGDALSKLDQRIAALADALNERTQNGGSVPPKLEALVDSLSEKIERIQHSRGDNVAVDHLEDRIVRLVEKLDASDSRLGHLEAIERGLADLLVHIEDMRAGTGASGIRADAPGMDSLKHDIARTQDALEAMHGTLGHVVDRLATIEQDIRGETGASKTAARQPDQNAPLNRPVGKVAARAVSDDNAAPPPTPPAPRAEPAPPVAAPKPAPSPPPAPRPAAKRVPINPDLPPDEPLEPGSGPPRGNPAARIAASEAALGVGRAPATGGPAGKSNFITAARRAAQAAAQEPAGRPARADADEASAAETPSMGARLAQRVKKLFVAASVIAIVVGSLQIASTQFGIGIGPGGGLDQTAAIDGKMDAGKAAPKPDTIAAANDEAPALPGMIPPPVFEGGTMAASPLPKISAPDAIVKTAPEAGQPRDITGSVGGAPAGGRSDIPLPAASPLKRPPQESASDHPPIAIGSVALREAAAAGNPAAAHEVAVRFAEGRGVPVSLEDAARWFERAADKNLAPAQFRLAGLLEKGQGVRKDLRKAQRLYLAAANQGHAKAMHNLGVLYAEGVAGKPDYATAVQWFRKAADRGVPDSQYNLGILHARGLGAEQDFAESYKWFALAAAKGDREAARKRDQVAAELDPEALAAAKRTVESWTAVPQPDAATTVPAPAGGWDRGSTGARAPKAKVKANGVFEIGKR